MISSIDLFSGYGGMALALKDYCKPIAYVEIEEYAQRIIAERMADGSLPRAPILADVKNVSGSIGVCDIITGGFPCQDISVAGNGAGLEGERSGLFFEIIRLVSECRPQFVFLENVPAITVRGLDRVLLEFSALRYDCRWTIVSAEHVGAPHKRERWFLLAHANSERGGQKQECEFREQDQTKPWNDGEKKIVANTTSKRPQRWFQSETAWQTFREHGCTGAFNGVLRLPKPAIRRDDDGTPHRVDRLKALGNGVVPEQARLAFEYLIGIANV